MRLLTRLEAGLLVVVLAVLVVGTILVVRAVLVVGTVLVVLAVLVVVGAVLLIVGTGGGWFRGGDGDRVGEVEADDGFRGDPDLLAAGEALDGGTATSAGSGTDGGTFAASEDSTEDGANGGATTDFFNGVHAAAFACDGVGVGGDGDDGTVTTDGVEFDGEDGASLEVGGVLSLVDDSVDGGADGDGHETVGIDLADDDTGEGGAGLGGLAIEGLGDADGDVGTCGKGDSTDDGWGRSGSIFRGWRERLMVGNLLLLLDGGGTGVSGVAGRGDGGSDGHAGDGEVVDDLFDSGDASGVLRGDGASGVIGYVAGESGDSGLDGDLDGLLADGGIAGEGGLDVLGERGVVY